MCRIHSRAHFITITIVRVITITINSMILGIGIRIIYLVRIIPCSCFIVSRDRSLYSYHVCSPSFSLSCSTRSSLLPPSSSTCVQTLSSSSGKHWWFFFPLALSPMAAIHLYRQSDIPYQGRDTSSLSSISSTSFPKTTYLLLLSENSSSYRCKPTSAITIESPSSSAQFFYASPLSPSWSLTSPSLLSCD